MKYGMEGSKFIEEWKQPKMQMDSNQMKIAGPDKPRNPIHNKEKQKYKCLNLYQIERKSKT